MNDDILIRLLNIAQDIDDGIERVEELSGILDPIGVDGANQLAAYFQEHHRIPPPEPLEVAAENVRGQVTIISDLVLDLMGVPPDNTKECVKLGILPQVIIDEDFEWPDAAFSRDWCQEQFFVAAETRRFKQAIARIRRAMADNFH